MIDKLLGGRYRVVGILGAGGFAKTYAAEDTHRPGNPKCVVKHLKPISSNSSFLQNARRLFQTEAETLEKLGNHDQIPRLLAYFEEDQEFYLVQEFIQGYPLIAELQPGQVWTESQVYQLLQEVLGILVFVHSHGVIHRDIKPNNLIQRQQDGRLVLLDFGSVKQAWTQVVTEHGQTNATYAVGIPATIGIGTPGYMPTEQGCGRPRPNSDIYALGIISIQALTGQNPMHLEEEAATGEILWQHRAHVSDGLASVIAKMVCYHFKDRYQTAAEALQALQLIVSREDLRSNAETPLLEQQPSLPQPTLLFPQLSQEPLPDSNLVLVPLTKRSHTSVNSHSTSATAISTERSRLLTPTSISAPQPTTLSPLKTQASPFSQNGVASEKTANSLTTQVSLPETYPSIPATHSQYRLWIGAGIIAVLVSLVAGYTIYWQPRASISKTLEQIENLKAEGKYEECVAQATTIPQNSHFYTDAQAFLHECKLAEATTLAATRKFKAAITEAGKIPLSSAYRQDAQQLISQWSDSILKVATNQYQSGKLNDAIAIAKAIPEISSVYQKAQGTIKQWNEEWEKNNSYLKAAQKALDEGKWQNAISEAKQVTDTRYWQKKREPIIQKAESKIAESKTALARTATRSTPRRVTPVTRTVTRTTPRRVTPSVARTAKRYTPKRATRTTPRRVTPSVTRTAKRYTPKRLTGTTPRRVTPSVTRTAKRYTPKRLTGTAPRQPKRPAPLKPSYTWTTKTVQ